MRHFRITLGLAATVCTFAVAAAPALAAEFVSSGGPSHGKGEDQVFHLGPFRIKCGRAIGKGGPTTPMNSKTFFTSLKESRCKTEAMIGQNPVFLHTTFKTPFAIEYHADGFVEIGSEGEEIEGNTTLKGGEIEIKIHAVKCTIRIPEQTLPHRAAGDEEETGQYNAAHYETVGSPPRHKLRIENEFKGIHFEYGEGQCEGFKTSEEERRQGSAHGELLEEVRGPKGNLEYVE